MRGREAAEEVLQESFVAIWERAQDYDPARGSAIGWLAAIVRIARSTSSAARRCVRPNGAFPKTRSRI
jgi:RNA polymerase sigma-70 factor (ECF subfamily)